MVSGTIPCSRAMWTVLQKNIVTHLLFGPVPDPRSVQCVCAITITYVLFVGFYQKREDCQYTYNQYIQQIVPHMRIISILP